MCAANGQLIVDQQEIPVVFNGLLQGGAHAGDR